jgi:hypothetical protein
MLKKIKGQEIRLKVLTIVIGLFTALFAGLLFIDSISKIVYGIKMTEMAAGLFFLGFLELIFGTTIVLQMVMTRTHLKRPSRF